MADEQNTGAAPVSIFEQKIPFEQAQKEVAEWLDYKRVKPSARIRKAGNISVLIEALMYGDISIDDQYRITHHLIFPIFDNAGKVAKEKLDYKPRLTLQELNDCEVSRDGFGIAVGAAMSGTATSIIGRLDASDAEIMSSVGIFFTS